MVFGLNMVRISKNTKHESYRGQDPIFGMGKSLHFGCRMWKLWG